MYRGIAGTDEGVRAIRGVRGRRVRATRVRLYFTINMDSLSELKKNSADPDQLAS